MRKTCLTIMALWLTISAFAEQKDSTTFRAYLYNNTFEVYLRINLYDEDIKVPGQELYGTLPGYLGKKNNSFCWVITSAKIKDSKTATLDLINDYGSEDLTATLTRKNDSIYILKQESGSTLKVPKNGKWQKIPKTIELKRGK
ncbi:MAG: hypothetical protein J6Q22_20405 [Prevotella sp.]|nr:hypothetical protein [Prevotella sp.]